VVAAAAVSWQREEERGSTLGIRLLVALTDVFGRGGGRLVLRFVMVWFVVFGGPARRASQAWLSLHLHSVRWRDVYRHFFAFGTVALDRFLLIRDRTDAFDLTYEGRELLIEQAATGKGAILLGSHLGSFEAMGTLARDHELPVHVVMFTEHARRISGLLEAAAPGAADRIVAIDPDDSSWVLRVKKLVDAGGFVALLGDRAVGRTVGVQFFGRTAEVAAGPYHVAAVLKCPVYLCTGLFEQPNRYRLICEPFARSIELPRASRDEALQGYAQSFADKLEGYARAHPFNWFNFYDFWG
jgi:predicted LPLAT superfamily acyltransferase